MEPRSLHREHKKARLTQNSDISCRNSQSAVFRQNVNTLTLTRGTEDHPNLYQSRFGQYYTIKLGTSVGLLLKKIR